MPGSTRVTFCATAAGATACPAPGRAELSGIAIDSPFVPSEEWHPAPTRIHIATICAVTGRNILYKYAEIWAKKQTVCTTRELNLSFTQKSALSASNHPPKHETRHQENITSPD